MCMGVQRYIALPRESHTLTREMVAEKSPAYSTTGLTTLYLLWVVMETVPYSALGNLKKTSEKLRHEGTEVVSGLSQWDITLEITHKRSSFWERKNDSVHDQPAFSRRSSLQ